MVLWLFVLVPMLISKRDAVRRTSDVALATRVLNGGAASRLLRRQGPAAGHRSDPDWQPEDVEQDEHSEDDDEHEADERPTHPVVVQFAVPEQAETDVLDVLDVDVIEDSGALPAGASEAETEPVAEAPDDASDDASDDAEPDTEPHATGRDDEYEYVDDSSGLEPDEDDDAYEEGAVPVPPAASRRRRFDEKTAAAVSARKYTFRKRVLMVMAVVLVGSATAAFEVTPTAWWVCSIATTITVFYLAYLRRQTRIEEKVRRRRMQRMARARLGVENAADREYDVVPSRLRRPGAVVLEIDDEDPIFEHLDYNIPARAYGWPRDLPRAVGQ
ncbi:hypothetical protein MCNS_43560 [Mycobacterium conspicuum]|uniref:Transmembrane protein n=1 Tax=Mycobacterium conspicuum TaxID=44010 RepID=A0A7I7YK73_9MYCO|nr:hypothetical protein MCNS_43560 [Mycobacterium conspicuum]